MTSLLRSMLYVPANSWRMINNAGTEGADAVILDLEDACPMHDKETGRIFARDSISMLKKQGVQVYVRVNAIDTGLTELDVNIVTSPGLDGIVLAKTESADQVCTLAEMLFGLERERDMPNGQTRILALLETPLAIMNLAEIALSSPRLVGLGFGAGDYSREMGAGMGVTGMAPEAFFQMVLCARSQIAMAARAYGLAAIDTPYFGLVIDLRGLAQECEQVRLLGFSGKQLTHPRHVEAANCAFSPAAAEVELAKNVSETFEAAQAQGLGATTLGGKMIDQGSYKRAQSVLALSDAIRARERRA